MRHIPFLKDALYLGPETEAVQKFLEGFPREIIWLESLWLEVKGKDCAVRYGKKKEEAFWWQGHFDPGYIQPFSRFVCSSIWAAGGARVWQQQEKRWQCSLHNFALLLRKKKCDY